MPILEPFESERKSYDDYFPEFIDDTSESDPFPFDEDPDMESTVFDEESAEFAEDESTEDEWDNGDIEYLGPDDDGSITELVNCDPHASVREWQVAAFGTRPRDYLTRDCLFASLLRNPRAAWFHTYLRRPSLWMESMVAKFPVPQRKLMLQQIALHFLHKSHLMRIVRSEYCQANEDFDNLCRIVRRLWSCPPIGALMRGKKGKVPHPCGMARLCPWCFARKVLGILNCMCKTLKNLGGLEDRVLLLGKARPFLEPRGGGLRREFANRDLATMLHGELVRGVRGRYYGQHSERIKGTRKDVMNALVTASDLYRLDGGVVFHQLGSGQDTSGYRSYVHDVALVGTVAASFWEDMMKDEDTGTFSDLVPLENSLHTVKMTWTPLPMCRSGIRAAVCGSSLSYASDSGIGPEKNSRGINQGIKGALSWQPTFLLDDHMYMDYVAAVSNQRLYRPFGSWKTELGRLAREERKSTDCKFAEAQTIRWNKDKQQKGNRVRHRQANDGRVKLLETAKILWPNVVSEVKSSRGRPSHRKDLVYRLKEQNIFPSRRDVNWLMQNLRKSQA